MINLEHITRSFGSRPVLSDLHAVVPGGSIVGLIGPSGGGKSVLLKIIAGVLSPDSGKLSIDVANPTDIGLMFQEGALFDSLSVFDNIAFPLVHGLVPAGNLPSEKLKEVHAKVQEILSRVGLTKASEKFPGQLSGGMRRRVSLARALVARPRLLLLDDPTAGLDPVASNVIMELISSIHREYSPTIVIASHDLRRLLPRVQEVYALFNGKLIFNGTIDALTSCGIAELLRFVSARYPLFPSCQPVTPEL